MDTLHDCVTWPQNALIPRLLGLGIADLASGGLPGGPGLAQVSISDRSGYNMDSFCVATPARFGKVLKRCSKGSYPWCRSARHTIGPGQAIAKIEVGPVSIMPKGILSIFPVSCLVRPCFAAHTSLWERGRLLPGAAGDKKFDELHGAVAHRSHGTVADRLGEHCRSWDAYKRPASRIRSLNTPPILCSSHPILYSRSFSPPRRQTYRDAVMCKQRLTLLPLRMIHTYMRWGPED